jgi:hypothetical protein
MHLRPARKAAEHGRGMGHMTLWCGTCSDQDHRDTRFYEPPRPSAITVPSASGHRGRTLEFAVKPVFDRRATANRKGARHMYTRSRA